MTGFRKLSRDARKVAFSATLSPLESIGQRLDTDIVVHCAGEALAAAQILFGRLNRSVPQEKLDLLQFAPSCVAQSSAGSPEVMRRQSVDSSTLGPLPHNPPD